MLLFRRVRNEQGATLVEHAIALPIVLIFLLMSFEMLRFAYIALTSQFVTSRVVRQAIVGPRNYAIDPYKADATSAYRAYVQGEISRIASSFGVAIPPANIAVTCVKAAACADPGGPNELVLVDLRVPYQLLFVGNFEVASSVIAKNERWTS